MTNIVEFSKKSQFQEYEVTGIVNRLGSDYISISLTLCGDPDHVSIPCSLKRDSGLDISMRQIIRARLASKAEIECQYGAPNSFKIEAIEQDQVKTHGQDLIQRLRLGVTPN